MQTITFDMPNMLEERPAALHKVLETNGITLQDYESYSEILQFVHDYDMGWFIIDVELADICLMSTDGPRTKEEACTCSGDYEVWAIELNGDASHFYRGTMDEVSSQLCPGYAH